MATHVNFGCRLRCLYIFNVFLKKIISNTKWNINNNNREFRLIETHWTSFSHNTLHKFYESLLIFMASEIVCKLVITHFLPRFRCLRYHKDILFKSNRWNTPIAVTISKHIKVVINAHFEVLQFMYTHLHTCGKKRL